MTLLDDYEARYKLQGVEIVSEMLRCVPKNLLKRTGVDNLIRTVRAMLVSRYTHLFNVYLIVSQHLPHAPAKSGNSSTSQDGYLYTAVTHDADDRTWLFRSF
jgi:Tti2 family